MPLNVEKDLPSLPALAEPGRHMLTAPSSTSGLVNATGSRPTLDLEKSLSPEELVFLHDRWNEATSARHVRFERQPIRHGRLRSAPIDPLDETENVPASISRGNDQASTPAPQRRWGFFKRKKPVAAASKSDEPASSSSKSIRSANFLNIAKTARSTPNLNAAAKASAQEATPVVRPVPREASIHAPVPKQSANAPAKQSGGAEPEELPIDINDGGIYLTFDPDWRTSCGDVFMTFLSPIPDEIPDSPIIHRRHSLDWDELQSWYRNPMPQAEPTRGKMEFEFIDELHSFLGFEE